MVQNLAIGLPIAKLALLAEEYGFEYGLTGARYLSALGFDNIHEPVTFAQALLAVTKKLKLISAVHPGMWHPGVLAKVVASTDFMSNGRFNLNVVSGWFKQEFIAFGQPWLEHDERYKRSEEFIRILKGIWTQDNFSFNGFYYNIRDYSCHPKPVRKPSPQVFQGGNSRGAQYMAARVSDWYFMNGATNEKLKEQIDFIKSQAKKHGREDKIRFAVNSFIIQRSTNQEAVDQLREIIANADVAGVKHFQEIAKGAGQSTQDKYGMWAESSFTDLIQQNDGFKTGLVGDKEEIANKILELKKIGVNLILCGFTHFQDELTEFGKQIIPLVRDKESFQQEQQKLQYVQ